MRRTSPSVAPERRISFSLYWRNSVSYPNLNILALDTVEDNSLLHCILNHHFSLIYLNEVSEQCVQLGFGSDDLAIFFSIET